MTVHFCFLKSCGHRNKNSPIGCGLPEACQSPFYSGVSHGYQLATELSTNSPAFTVWVLSSLYPLLTASSILATSDSSSLDSIPPFPDSNSLHGFTFWNSPPHPANSNFHLPSKYGFSGSDHKAKLTLANSITRQPGTKAVG